MPVKFDYSKRSEQNRARLEAKREAQLRAYGDPKPQPKFLAESVVSGKPVADWGKVLTAAEVAADDHYRETHQTQVIDLVKLMPKAAAVAVTIWRKLGCPTEYDETAKKLAELREKADAQAALAQMEDGKVRDFVEVGKGKKAEQHRGYAEKHRENAAAFLAEAEKVAADWKKSHPGR